MILIEEVSREWKRDGDWRIAPAGLTWIAEGSRVFIGDGARIGSDARIGDGAVIGSYASIGDGARIGSDASIGDGAVIGSYASIGDGARIGSDASIGDGAEESFDLGFADGYRKCVCNVKGVAYIGAGCRWFTLDAALRHWAAKPDRELTMCLMQSAVAIAGLRGWKFGG